MGEMGVGSVGLKQKLKNIAWDRGLGGGMDLRGWECMAMEGE